MPNKELYLQYSTEQTPALEGVMVQHVLPRVLGMDRMQSTDVVINQHRNGRSSFVDDFQLKPNFFMTLNF
jgi:hypothetical protein